MSIFACQRSQPRTLRGRTLPVSKLSPSKRGRGSNAILVYSLSFHRNARVRCVSSWPSDRRGGPLLAEKLVKRFFAARSREQIITVLRLLKDSDDNAKRELRISGNLDDLEKQFSDAVGRGWITTAKLAKMVDEAEENGNQHVFLFNLTEAGLKALTSAIALSRFKRESANPTEALYEALPEQTVFVRATSDDAFIVKEVFTATYWVTSSTTHPTDDEEIIVRNRLRQRAMNMLVIDSSQRRAEIRIARIDDRGETIENTVVRLKRFIDLLQPWLSIDDHLTPVPIWDSFPLLQQNRDEVVMPSDKSASSTSNQNMSIRKRGTHADIRDDPDYPKSAATHARTEMRIEWIRGRKEDGDYIPCRLAEFKVDKRQLAKIEIRARLQMDALSYVIGRIRYFTTLASE